MPSIFETINQRADAIKAHRWRNYKPLTAFQLTDYDAAADDDDPEDTSITLLAHTADFNPPLRSTQRSVKPYKQFKILKRPTEARAILRANGRLADDDVVLVIVKNRKPQQRWCILCQDRHPRSDFIHHQRYLNGWSYACKKSLREGFRGHRWRLTA